MKTIWSKFRVAFTPVFQQMKTLVSNALSFIFGLFLIGLLFVCAGLILSSFSSSHLLLYFGFTQPNISCMAYNRYEMKYHSLRLSKCSLNFSGDKLTCEISSPTTGIDSIYYQGWEIQSRKRVKLVDTKTAIPSIAPNEVARVVFEYTAFRDIDSLHVFGY